VMEPQELSLKEINEAEDHEAKLLGKEAEYWFIMNPYNGFVDEVMPQDTRPNW
jgi:propionyl-CoA carboxylase beta chain